MVEFPPLFVIKRAEQFRAVQVPRLHLVPTPGAQMIAIVEENA